MNAPIYKTEKPRTTTTKKLDSALAEYKKRVMEYLDNPTKENYKRSSRRSVAADFGISRCQLQQWHAWTSQRD